MADRRSLLFLVFSLFLFFEIQGVCSETCAPVNKDINVLKEQPYWQFEVSNGLLGCKPFHPPGVTNVSTTCLFYFSVCHPVPRFCPENSGICLANKIDYGPRYNETLYTMPITIGGFTSDSFKSELKYFTLTYLVDQEPPIITVITFTCNESAMWHKTEDGKVTYHPSYVLNSTKEGIITYNIGFQYKGACPGGGGGGGGGGGDEEPSKPLSIGSIMLCLFFPGIFLYCVVGALINKGAGKTGKEVMPNSKFWTELPGLISDGFSFVVAKITCSDMSTSRETYDRM